jgi:hypothetical protein
MWIILTSGCPYDQYCQSCILHWSFWIRMIPTSRLVPHEKESPKSGCKVLHKIRGKNRVFRTYKINKTIAKMVTGQMEAAATAATAAVRVRGRKPGSGRRAPVHQSKDQNKDDDGGEEMPLVDGNIDDNNVSEDDKTAPISVVSSISVSNPHPHLL